MKEPCMCGGCKSCLGPAQCSECGVEESEECQLDRYYSTELCPDCLELEHRKAAAEERADRLKDDRLAGF